MYYRKGEIVMEDDIETLRKKAELGDAVAQCKLSEYYYKGKGVKQDYEQAVAWCRKAAEQGYSEGEFWLAIMYYWGSLTLVENGKGKDRKKACEWFEKAATHGHAEAKKWFASIMSETV